MGAFPVELRRRILAAYAEDGCTMREVADRFMVSVGFVHRLVTRFEQTGCVEPCVPGGARPKLSPDDEGALVLLVQAQPDATLDELRAELERSRHVTLTTSGVHRALQRLGLTYKNSRSGRPSSHVRTSRRRASGSSAALAAGTRNATSSSTNSA